MKPAFLIFPIHLFSNIDSLQDKTIYLIEEPRYFQDFHFHKLKLVYHRASMKSYFDYLKDHHIQIHYISFDEVTPSFYKSLLKKHSSLECYDPNDYPLQKKLEKSFKQKLSILSSLNFTLTPSLIFENKHLFQNKTGNYRHDSFYEWQRTRLNILMTKDGKPKGGQWSFDKDNRKPLPKNIPLTFEPPILHNEYYQEAQNYIEERFPNHYGNITNTIYPIDHSSAKKWLKQFLQERFKNFGTYEDAETNRNPFLFHSVLTPMMNIGLLTDTEVLHEASLFEDKVPIASYEGFIRQIIGWRNYVYSIYVLEGPTMKKQNFMKYKIKLHTSKWWLHQGQTVGILPIDYILQKIVDYSYAHHIERLMYLGNLFFIMGVDPKEVYRMFMEWTIDAYEWVMVPNVMGMSQYADGGKMMTRPYFSSSNYILKMSDWKKGEWCDEWNILYYAFMGKHREMLKKNYATAQQVVHWDRKSKSEQKEIMKRAKELIQRFR